MRHKVLQISPTSSQRRKLYVFFLSRRTKIQELNKKQQNQKRPHMGSAGYIVFFPMTCQVWTYQVKIHEEVSLCLGQTSVQTTCQKTPRARIHLERICNLYSSQRKLALPLSGFWGCRQPPARYLQRSMTAIAPPIPSSRKANARVSRHALSLKSPLEQHSAIRKRESIRTLKTDCRRRILCNPW